MSYKITELKEGIQFIDVESKSGLKVRLCTYGASVYSLYLNDMPLILELKDIDTFLNGNQYYGKTLGRVAGRIKCEGELDGVKYHLVPTEEYDYCLHGGDAKSLSYQNFDVKVKEASAKTSIIFTYTEKDKTNGFPGKVKTTITYEIYEGTPKFKILFKATTNKTTYVNLSNHMYFNFNNDLDLIDYKLKMNASKCGEVDNTVFITHTVEVPNYLDFKKASKLKVKNKGIEKCALGTIDNTFLFDEVIINKPQVTLQSKDVKLSLYTSYPAMNIYLDNSLTPVEFNNNSNFSKRRGIALEPQLYDLDLDSIILRKGEKYNHFIMYKFKDLRK